MITCPLCGFDNIEGVDGCEQCGQPLADTHLRKPRTPVEQGLLTDRVDALKPKTPITVSPEMTVGEVLKLMVDRGIGSVFIAKDQRIKGVFTERDALLRLGADYEKCLERPIAEFMTRNPQSLKANAKVAFAVHQMDVGEYRHLPIVEEDGTAKGVISVRDILRYLKEKLAAAATSQ